MTTLQGVKINEIAIARGLYNMMNDDQRNLLAFGMLDNKLIKVLEDQTTQKYNRMFHTTYGCSPEEWDKDMADTLRGLEHSMDSVAEKRTAFVNALTVEVSKALYGVASGDKAMVV